jgi:hypothetical protein
LFAEKSDPGNPGIDAANAYPAEHGGAAMALSMRTIHTSKGDIAVAETSGRGMPVVFIHGNSSCK